MRGALPALLALALAASGAAAQTLPRVGLRVAPAVIAQGQVAEVRVWLGAPAARIDALAGAGRIPLYAYRDGLRGFLPTNADTDPGIVTLRLEVRLGGGIVRRAAPVRVRSGAFRVRRLHLDPRTASLLSEEASARERERVLAATATTAPGQLWTPPFAWPVRGRVSSPYGVRSYYNGERDGYHGGIDIAAKAGTPVRAANAGIVVLAEALPVSGNTVILDHGQGVFTSYQHLSAIAVRPGERVAKRAVVGRVGSTGLSTGPHLHFGMRVNGLRVDPAHWLR